ncbi:MAG: hypothetical protein ACLSVX_02375 [Massilimicrobiota timonensis]
MDEKTSVKKQVILDIIERCKENIRRFDTGEKEVDVITNDEEYYIALGMIFQLMVNHMIVKPKRRNLIAKPLLNAKTNKECIRAFMNVYKKAETDSIAMTWQGILISETLMYKDEEVNVKTDDEINLMIGWISYCKDLGEA